MLSGTPVTMPAKTPQEHEENFRAQARKLKIAIDNRSSVNIAQDMINAPVDDIRELSFVGAPSTDSELLPYQRPTMQHSRAGPGGQVKWLESQVVSAASYDGSISYIITKKNPKRGGHANSFIKIASEVMKHADKLLRLYAIMDTDEDMEALEKICLFESDIGFFAAADAIAQGSIKTKTYFQYFDLGNPFDGFLEKGKFATHSWDIVALLGAYDARLSHSYSDTIRQWRVKLIEYAATGKTPWPEYSERSGLRITRVSDPFH